MAILYSNLYGAIPTVGTSAGAITTTTSYVYKGPTVKSKGEAIVIAGVFDCANGLLNGTNTQLFLCALPQNGKISRISLAPSADIDSGNTFTFNLGTVALATAYASASTALQAVTGFSTPATIATDADQGVALFAASESLILARQAGATTSTTGLIYFQVLVGIP